MLKSHAKWMIAVFCGLCVAGAFYVGSRSDFFPVRAVKVYSEFNYLDKRSLKASLMPLTTGNIFTLDKKKIKKRLKQTIWVEKVEIKRRWPETLVINIKERTVAARFNEASLIDSHAKVFTPLSVIGFENKVRLLGAINKASRLLQEYKKVRKIVEPIGTLITTYRVDKRGVRHIYFTDGMEVTVGSAKVLVRIKRFVGVYSKIKTKHKKITHVDLRYLHGMAVKS